MGQHFRASWFLCLVLIVAARTVDAYLLAHIKATNSTERSLVVSLAANYVSSELGVNFEVVPFQMEENADITPELVAELRLLYQNSSISGCLITDTSAIHPLIARGSQSAVSFATYRGDSALLATEFRINFTAATWAKSVLAVASYYNWTSISVVYYQGDTSEVDYNNYIYSVADAVQRESKVGGATVSVAMVREFNSDGTILAHHDETYMLDVRTVVIIASPKQAHRFMSVSRAYRDDKAQYIWLFPTSSNSAPELAELLEADPLHEYGGFLGLIPSFAHEIAVPSAIQNLNMSVDERNIIFDSVLALGYAVKTCENTTSCNPANSTDLFQKLTSLEYDGLSGTVAFSESQTRQGDIQLINWDPTLAAPAWRPIAVYSTFNQLHQQDGSGVDVAVLLYGTTQVPKANFPALVEVGVAVPLQIHPEFNQWIDALHLAEQHIVEDGMLSDFEFHIHIVDTQMDEAIAMEGVLHAVAEENLSGFFGGLLLDETLPMQYILKSSHVPQIAPIEASPQMANRELHPYFMTPTVSGVDEARALLALLENYGWMYFAAVHSQFADGVLPTETIMNLAGSASYTGPKIVSRSTFDLTQPATIRVALQSIVDSGTRVVYFPGRTDEIQQVFAVAAELNMFEAGSWVWIVGNRITLSELWATQSNIPGGVLGIGIYTGEGPTYDRMVSDLRTRFNSSTEHPHSLSATGKLTPGTALMYDSVMTVLMGKYNLQQKNASLLGDGASLLRSYDTVSFQGATGQVRYSAGQRIGGIVSFINKVGTSWIPFASVKINSTAAESLSLQISSSPVFLGGSSTVPKDRFLQYVDWENGAGIVIVAVACLIMLGVLVTLIVVIRLRLNPLIRASSPAFLIVVLVGTFMALASIFPSTGIPTVAGCTTRVWLFVYGFVLAYGAILIKNWRIWRLWTEDSFRIIRISNLHLMGYSLIFVAPFSLLLIVWTVVAIPSPVIRGASIVCDQPSIVWPVLEFVAMGLMLVAGVIFSFLTRNLPQLFNECKYIALATYNMTFSLAVGVALSLVLQNTSVLASYLCYAIGVIFAFGGLWLIIFAPKLFWITFRPEKVAGLSSGTSHSNPTASSVYSPSTSSSPTIHGGSASAVLRSRRSSGKASQGSSERRRSQRGGKSSAELSTVVSVSNREEAHEVPPAPKAGKQQRRLEDQVQEEHVIDMEKPPQIENKKKKRVEDDVDKTKPDETTDRGKSKTKSAQENK